jgi:hypothetical protein
MCASFLCPLGRPPRGLPPSRRPDRALYTSFQIVGRGLVLGWLPFPPCVIRKSHLDMGISPCYSYWHVPSQREGPLMGCDIHMRAEVRRDGRWEAVGEIFDCWWREGEKTAEPYGNRNYRLFAMLADVRNGYGFAGVPTGSGFKPISDSRDFPDDLSPAIREWAEDGRDWGHSFSWLSLRELRDYDWDGQVSTIYGVVSAKDYECLPVEGKAPDSWSGGIGGPGIVTFTPEDYENWKASGRPNVHDDSNILTRYRHAGETKPYVRMSWPWTYREAAGEDWFEAMDRLDDLVPEGGTAEDVRIVFYFDS